jgi:Bacterial Ig-like domain
MKRFKAQQIYFALIMLILSVFLITGCGSDEVAQLTAQHDSVLPGACHETGPKVTLSNPSNNDDHVATDTLITVTFDEAMDPKTIEVTDAGDPESLAFTLRDNDHPLVNVEGTVAMDVTKTIATFTPKADLHGDSWYTATISVYAKNAGGTRLGCSYQWKFKTAVTPQ